MAKIFGTHAEAGNRARRIRPGGMAMRAALILLAGLPGAVAAQPPSPPIDSDLAQPQSGTTPAYPAGNAPADAPYQQPPYQQAAPAYQAAQPYQPAPAYQQATPPYQAASPYQPAPSYQAAPPYQAASPYQSAPPYQPAPTYQPPMPIPVGCAGSRYHDGTYHQDDLVGVANDIFGEAAHGLADIIQDILKKQGRPNGYIIGREASGAIGVGLRYGSGTLCSRLGWKEPVYWTGPSFGFDVGASAAKTFVLVYNLYRDQDIYHRFLAGEGQAYFVGGFHISYLRNGDVALIPVRMGVGMRLGVNGGYMKFSHRQNWFPF